MQKKLKVGQIWTNLWIKEKIIITKQEETKNAEPEKAEEKVELKTEEEKPVEQPKEEPKEETK